MQTQTQSFKTKDGQVIEAGTQIYYTGDMANPSGIFEVDRIYSTGFYPVMVDLIELNRLEESDSRKMKGLMPSSFEPGPGCRFVTMAKWEADRKAALQAFNDRMDPPFSKIKRLEAGKYTVVKYGEFGFLQGVKLNLLEVRVQPWAQYPETVLLVGRPFGKRKLIGIRILPQDRFAIWKEFLNVRTSMWVENERGNGVVIKKSLLSCDGEYLRMALDSVKEAPLAVKREYGEGKE